MFPSITLILGFRDAPSSYSCRFVAIYLFVNPISCTSSCRGRSCAPLCSSGRLHRGAQAYRTASVQTSGSRSTSSCRITVMAAVESLSWPCPLASAGRVLARRKPNGCGGGGARSAAGGGARARSPGACSANRCPSRASGQLAEHPRSVWGGRCCGFGPRPASQAARSALRSLSRSHHPPPPPPRSPGPAGRLVSLYPRRR